MASIHKNQGGSSDGNSIEKNIFDAPQVIPAPGDYDQNYFEELVHAGEHLHRGLSSRQVTMIAIGGAIGTGLIIGT